MNRHPSNGYQTPPPMENKDLIKYMKGYNESLCDSGSIHDIEEDESQEDSKETIGLSKGEIIMAADEKSSSKRGVGCSLQFVQVHRKFTNSNISGRRRGSVSKRINFLGLAMKKRERSVVPPNFALKRDKLAVHEFSHGIPYFDWNGRNDILQCKDYVTDIYQQMFENEKSTHQCPYIQRRANMSSNMRAIAVDWLIELTDAVCQNPITLYLSVSIFDRYCARVSVEKKNLQLVAVTALFIACKYEEVYSVPSIAMLTYSTDYSYTKSDLILMERSIVRELYWRLSVPTAYSFLTRFLALIDASDFTKNAAQYYIERVLQEHAMLKYLPSQISCAAVVLAVHNDKLYTSNGYSKEKPHVVSITLLTYSSPTQIKISNGTQPIVLLHYTGFRKKLVIEICHELANYVTTDARTVQGTPLNAAKMKFESKSYMKVSTVTFKPLRQNSI